MGWWFVTSDFSRMISGDFWVTSGVGVWFADWVEYVPRSSGTFQLLIKS